MDLLWSPADMENYCFQINYKNGQDQIFKYGQILR